MKDAAITYGGLCVPQGQTKHGNAPILDTAIPCRLPSLTELSTALLC